MRSRLPAALAVLMIFGLAFALRCAYMVQTEVDNPFRGDAVAYLSYAYNLEEHGTFSRQVNTPEPQPDAYWAPGYPLLLAAISVAASATGGDFYETLMLLQAMLGALLAAITVLIGLKFMPLGWATLAGILTALSPHAVGIGANILTETLFAFLLGLALLAYARAIERPGAGLLAGAGALFGLSYLVNPVVFFAPLVLAILLATRSPCRDAQAARPMLRLAVFLCAFLLFPAGWAVRNALNVAEEQDTGADRVRHNLVIGAHADFFDVWRNDSRDPANPATLDNARTGGSTWRFLQLLADRMAADPGHYASWYLLEKPALLWDWDIRVGQGDIYVFPVTTSLYQRSRPAIVSYVAMKSLHPWLMLAGLGGIAVVAGSRRGRQSTVALSVALIVVYISAVYIVLQSEPRYSIPLRAEMYLCAAFFFSMGAQWLASRRNPGPVQGDPSARSRDRTAV